MLLAIIYISFISLGLPDSLLGSAWPVMRTALDVPISYAGILTMIISGGTIVSTLLTDRVIRAFGTGRVTAFSVALTAAALLGFSVSNSFVMLCLCAIPYGFGAGAVDAALNNYVALHYSSRHMSWLHAFWGVGVSISPNIMSFCLTRQFGWQAGYRAVGILQVVLSAALFMTLYLWKGRSAHSDDGEAAKVLSIREAFRIRGVAFVMLTFFAYCSLESTAGLWASSYLAEYRHIPVETAAGYAMLFYVGMMSGRFLNGFIADRFGDRRMIRAGIYLILAGITLVAIPFKSNAPALAGLVIIGLGAAPVYPCLIHSTPVCFGRENSQSLVGMQMSSAYIGTTFMPPLFGLAAQYIDIALYPAFLAVYALVMLLMFAFLCRATKQ